MARGLARAGASLSLWARDEARNEEAAKELATWGVEIQTIGCDVSSERAVEEATQSALDRFGESTSALRMRASGLVGAS